MSVYTTLSESDISPLLAGYDLGTLVSFRGIEAGIENTNYFVTTSQGEFVLTLFEHHHGDEVREFVLLARHLGDKGLAVPAPISNRNNVWLHDLCNRPAILCQRLPGSHVANPQPGHCRAIGEALARMHIAAADLKPRRVNDRGYDWWISISPELSSDLSADDQALLSDELEYQRQQHEAWTMLPHGWIHGDLFHDNALFSGEQQLGAILDLYNACDGALLYDLAIIANDWCCTASGEWKEGTVDALLDGYESVRPLTAEEKDCWNLVLRGAALRFWLSRLLTVRIQRLRAAEMTLHKDPDEFKHKLLMRRTAV